MGRSYQAPKLFVFLGNPGRQYAQTRHNVGWIVGDEFASRIAPGVPSKQKFNGRFLGVSGVTLLFPETFMNKSGESVRRAVDFFSIPPEQVLVVHDDIELDFGVLRLEIDGGLRGHNGLKSLKQHLNTAAFWRLRVGVGRPTHKDSRARSHVLARFSKDEETRLSDVVSGAVEMIDSVRSNPEPAHRTVPT